MLSRIACLSAVALAAVLVCGPARAHAQRVPDSPTLPAPTGDPNSPLANSLPPNPERDHMLRNMSRERNEIRQKEIVDDTQQLLDLAKQLKDAVDKSSKDQLSLSVVNTAAEIEKLAKTVKEKMRDGQ